MPLRRPRVPHVFAAAQLPELGRAFPDAARWLPRSRPKRGGSPVESTVPNRAGTRKLIAALPDAYLPTRGDGPVTSKAEARSIGLLTLCRTASGS
jgi:hypothetical protein